MEPPPPLRQAFRAQFGEEATAWAFAPGRVNLIGEHTDYTGGLVLPTTVSRGIDVLIRLRPDRMCAAHALDLGAAAVHAIDRRPADDAPLWQQYVFGVTFELQQAGLLTTGGQLLMRGNLPRGAGLSSSAALCVGVALAWQQALRFEMTGEAMARLCQRVEQVHAGVACGIMDQMAVRLGQRGHALFLDCHMLTRQHLPLDWHAAALLILDTKVARTLAGSAYNDRRATCEAALARLQQAGWPLESLRTLVPRDLPRLATALPPHMLRRVRHIVTENARVRQAVDALRTGEYQQLGQAMLASHDSLRDDFEVSCPELDHLVDTAQRTPGVFGARMTGAGFGGCALALVHPGALQAAAEHLAHQFEARFGASPGLLPLTANRAAAAESL